MEKIKVVVIFGGCSTEYEVSLKSAGSVIINLNPQKYDVELIGITRQGVWMKYDGAVEKIMNDTWMNSCEAVPAVISPDRNTHGILTFKDSNVTVTRVDVVFPVLHGKNGEDGTLQGLLTMAGIPFVGCDTLSSAMCMDKDIAHQIVQLAGVKTPPSIVLKSRVTDAELLERVASLRYPLFVKPAKGGSSLGMTKVWQKSELPGAVTDAFQHDTKVIIEEGIDGFEVGCAILGNDILTIGEVDEIELSHVFYDYTEKYTPKNAKIHMPANVDPDMVVRIKQTATLIYRALNCSGFARVDMFVTPEKEIVFNEVNTIPGFTAHSRYPNMLKAIGMTFEQLLDEAIRLAINS